MISLKYSLIKKIAFVYISLPLICFFAGWLKWYYAVPSILAVIICLLISFLKNEDENEDSINISFLFIIIAAIISVAYCFFCGIGRLWAQSKDYPWRNAVFRDIILREWPVLYEKYEGALSYYISIWLPPALLGKLSLIIHRDADLAFRVANIGLLIYCSIGIFFKPAKKYQMYLSLLMFIFFSGMDILGSIEPLGANNYHLEWWAIKYQYSSFTTCMCWVFNQAIIPWICMLLILKEKKVKHYVFIGMCCLFSGPLPFIGLFIYCISIGIYRLACSIKDKDVKEYLKEILSIPNILSVFLIFPFVGLYMLSNGSFQGGGGVQLSGDVVNAANTYNIAGINNVLMEMIGYSKFVLAEFLVFMMLVFRKYRKDYLFYVTLTLLLLFPFARVGYAYDFTMRASIPSLLYLYLICTKYVFEEKDVLKKQEDKFEDKKKYLNNMFKRYSYVALVFCLLLGAFTPSVEFIRGFRQVAMRGVDDIMTDYIYTLGEDNYSTSFVEDNGASFTNFVAFDYKDVFFYKHFAK